MAPTQRLSERLAIVATIDPDAYGAGTEVSDIIDMKDWKRVIFVFLLGTLVSTNTTICKIQSGDATLSDAADLSGKTATTLTEAGADSDKQVIIEVTSEEVEASGDRYIRASMVLGTAGADCGMVALGEPAHYLNVTGQDLSTVDEIVA
jgi:hypothetical protein